MKEYCREHLIRSRTSNPYTPQQNGLAERHNRTILESLRTILKDSGFGYRFWSDIVKVSTLTLNQIPAHKSKKSPFEMFKNRSISLDFFRPIGNRVSYLITPQKPSSKLMPKGELGSLLG
jgi:transposase InsO family protein